MLGLSESGTQLTVEDITKKAFEEKIKELKALEGTPEYTVRTAEAIRVLENRIRHLG